MKWQEPLSINRTNQKYNPGIIIHNFAPVEVIRTLLTREGRTTKQAAPNLICLYRGFVIEDEPEMKSTKECESHCKGKRKHGTRKSISRQTDTQANKGREKLSFSRKALIVAATLPSLHSSKCPDNQSTHRTKRVQRISCLDIRCSCTSKDSDGPC